MNANLQLFNCFKHLVNITLRISFLCNTKCLEHSTARFQCFFLLLKIIFTPKIIAKFFWGSSDEKDEKLVGNFFARRAFGLALKKMGCLFRLRWAFFCC